MATTPAPIPSADDLQDRARTTAGRCGVALGTPAAHRATTSPINGEHLHSLEWVDGRSRGRRGGARTAGVPVVADGAGARARRRRQAAGRAADASTSATWPP